jgi:hypothetical protein
MVEGTREHGHDDSSLVLRGGGGDGDGVWGMGNVWGHGQRTTTTAWGMVDAHSQG